MKDAMKMVAARQMIPIILIATSFLFGTLPMAFSRLHQSSQIHSFERKEWVTFDTTGAQK